MSGHQYNPLSRSALQTAIIHRDLKSITALLELGAEAKVDYSTYIISFTSKWALFGSSEYNEQRFRHNFEQPVFTATYSEMPSLVPTLLDAGAEINTLCTKAQQALDQRNSHSEGVHSLLDAVRERIMELSNFLETGKVKTMNYGSHRTGPTEPIPLKDDKEYLQGLHSDTYVYWFSLKQLRQEKNRYEQDLTAYKDSQVSQEEPAGTSEKNVAVKSLLAEFEALEKQLIERGAKTFKELYPDYKFSETPQYNHYGYEPPEIKPWAPSITFQLSDLTEERLEAYIKLFQACWDGDLSTVKELTLLVWGDDQGQSPLKIAVKDAWNFSPFSLAVLRKHFDLAKAILEIAHAQYAPTEQPGQTRRRLGPAADEDENSTADETDFQIYTEIIDDQFTFEGIGAVQSQVKSSVTPLEMIFWSCPVSRFLEDDYDLDVTTAPAYNWFGGSNHDLFGRYAPRKSNGVRAPRKLLRDAANGRTYHVQRAPTQEYLPEVIQPGNIFQLAIFMDDEELLDFMITMGEEYTVRKSSHQINLDERKPTIFRFDELDFQYAIRFGRIQLMQHIIRRTGAGMPLDNIVKESGIEIVVKPKYYQGLSVHGKKRADWANAGRDIQCELQQEQHPPLLHAARLANLESVEWFLSDAAPRCYIEFAKAHHEDVRIQNLGKVKGGLAASINKWLNLRSHLLLHCIVLHKTTKDTVDLLQFLCKNRPETLQYRSSSGLTALQLAFALHRVEMIKVLIAAGADQTCRNNVRGNIIHSTLNTLFNTGKGEEKAIKLRELLNLVDARLIPSLFEERTTESPGAATPLARWLRMKTAAEDQENLLRVILEFSKGEDLEIINAEGDTPVHMVVRLNADRLLRIMLERRPELLFRENATGRTPYEMAEDAFLSKEVFNGPPSLTPSSNPHGGRNGRWYSSGMEISVGIVAREPHTFIEDADRDTQSSIEKTWHVCKEFAEKTRGTKRKLVKLVEANEVAKRLAKRKGSRFEDEVGTFKEEQEEEEEEEEIKGDEVDLWYSMGMIADR